MDDDVEISDNCPECGHYTYWQECHTVGCDDGYIDAYDEDPLWYDPGDLEICTDCHGRGHHNWCPNCGYDLVAKQYLNGKPENDTAAP